MADKADVAEAIARYVQEAAAALRVMQAGKPRPLTLDGFAAMADPPARTTEDMLADELEQRGLLDAFVTAMAAQGAFVASEDPAPTQTNFSEDVIARGRGFRARVLVGGEFRGSGCLIGPSLVLTAWHVIVTEWPDAPDAPAFPRIEVELSDHTKRRAWPKPIFFSPCTRLEFDEQLPNEDSLFSGFADIALLKLERPDGMRLGYAKLPSKVVPPVSRSAIVLFHFPNGADNFYGFGKIAKFRGITARWKHDVSAAPGSSGGPCFNTRFDLTGVHQGRWTPHRRLVPANVFVDKIRPFVEQDIAPPVVWSLDGTSNGRLVIGRDVFFEAVAAATRPASRVRGVRVKRLDPGQGTTGLAFSLEMLTLTLARNPGTHRTLRINFETLPIDLLDEIRRRARALQLDVPPAEPEIPDVRQDETTAEATANERASALAAELNGVAERGQQLIWLLFDNPPGGLTDAVRFGFEAFLAAALRQPRLRLLLTGFETVPTPGEEFSNASFADREGAPGLVVEYFGRFTAGDVEQLLSRACRDLGVTVTPAEIALRGSQILQGVSAMNMQYSASDLETVVRRAASHLDDFQTMAGAQG
jgi:trypsin-like peptidase